MNIKVLKPETVTCWTLRFLFLQVRKAQIILSKYGTLLAHDSQEKRHRKSQVQECCRTSKIIGIRYSSAPCAFSLFPAPACPLHPFPCRMIFFFQMTVAKFHILQTYPQKEAALKLSDPQKSTHYLSLSQPWDQSTLARGRASGIGLVPRVDLGANEMEL